MWRNAAWILGFGPLLLTLAAVGMDAVWRLQFQQAFPLLGSYLGAFVAAPLALAAVGGRQRILQRATLLTVIALAIGFVMHAGIGPFVALGVFLACALVLGSRLAGSAEDQPRAASVPFVMLGGSALILALVGWLLPFRVHAAGGYLAAFTLLLCWRRAALRSGISMLRGQVRDLLERAPGWSLAAVWAMGLASVLTWLPTLGYDDNSGHLLLAEQLMADGYYRMDVSTHAGALTPWLNNVLHGVLTVISGADARPAVGVFWLLAGATGAYRFARSLGADEPAIR